MEQVAPDGTIIDHIDGRTILPGHAIEAAWFILNQARHLGNDKRLIDLGTRIIDYMWERGWDKEYGGIYYFRDAFHKPVQEYYHDMKFWWPHNELIIAALLAHLLTGDEKYAKIHEFFIIPITVHKGVESSSLSWFIVFQLFPSRVKEICVYSRDVEKLAVAGILQLTSLISFECSE